MNYVCENFLSYNSEQRDELSTHTHTHTHTHTRTAAARQGLRINFSKFLKHIKTPSVATGNGRGFFVEWVDGVRQCFQDVGQ